MTRDPASTPFSFLAVMSFVTWFVFSVRSCTTDAHVVGVNPSAVVAFALFELTVLLIVAAVSTSSYGWTSSKLLFAVGLALMIMSGLRLLLWKNPPDSETRAEASMHVPAALVGGTVALLLFWGSAAAKKSEDHEAERLRVESIRSAAANAREEKRRMRKQEETSARETQARCIEQSRSSLAAIATESAAASTHLGRAESEFADGAFAPFWDAVEQAASRLAIANKAVDFVIECSREYRATIGHVPASSPSFDVQVGSIPDMATQISRLEKIVRAAQKHPNFATIYELRRINRSIIQGFSTLGEALSQLPDRFDNSIELLRTSLDGMSDEQGRQSEMLDNIQRRRKPRE